DRRDPRRRRRRPPAPGRRACRWPSDRGRAPVIGVLRLAFLGLVRTPGRTLLRLAVLAAASALLGSMVLFIGASLRTMTASAVRSVPLDWQGPVGSLAA